jgi:putative cardiolipin synthase
MKFNRKNMWLLWLLGVVLLWTSACAKLPPNNDRTPSSAITDGQKTLLGRHYKAQLVDHEGKSGVFLLSSGLDAFVARAILTQLAQASIDVQYYMFHQDTVGQLLLNELLRAADRGVRVRVLIDDIYGGDADDVWTALDSHPQMEVRLFNPFVRDASKNLQWITRFSDLNYRMHSKSFTVDNQATIVGGRNIGDEYFDASPDLAFADLDLFSIGPVVPKVSAAFDEYWNSDYAYPASTLTQPVGAEQLDAIKQRLYEASRQEEATVYIEALKNSGLAQGLLAGGVDFKWAEEAIVIHDSSEKKARKENWNEELLISKLWPYLDRAAEELIIVSPYFIPGKKGADALCKMSQRGVNVRILTNSLASNDVAAVHAGYSKYRKQLLGCEVTLYELDERITEKAEAHFTWLKGLSKSSLHAKSMVIDRKAMFVGSMNLDPRSLHINNEIGILFLNPEIAEESARNFDLNIEKAAFRLSLDPDNGDITWQATKQGEEIIYDTEPYVGFWKRFFVDIIRLLPVESQL